MAFFRNSTVNLLNLHYGLHVLAFSGGGAFYLAYLYRAGIPAPLVLATIAGVLLGRFLLRPLIIPLGIRIGLRALLILGTLLSAFQYLALSSVTGIGPALFVLIAASAIGDCVYWTSYHAYFAALGDNEHRGHQISAREAIAAAVGVISPIAAGWAIVTLGAQTAFVATTLVVIASATPFFFTPDVKIATRAPGVFKAARLGLLLFAADGWMAAGWLLSWQVALFVTLGESYLAFGGAMALSAFVGAAAGLLLGRSIDKGQGRRMAWAAVAAVAFVIALRATSVGAPALAIVANSLGALASCLIVPAQMTPVYTLAKGAPCPLRFHVVCEGGWDLGGASGLLCSAGLLALGAPLGAAVAVALPGAIAILLLLRKYYADAGAPAGIAA